MNISLSIKKIGGGVGVLLFLIALFFSRNWIANQFSSYRAPNLAVSEATPQFSVLSSPQDSVSPSPTAKVSLRPTPSLPSYHGRDTEEVRPVPDEVKLFSESQKQQIYGSIGNYGKAVKENPDFFSGWIHIGVLKKTIGDYEGARDVWEYASMIRPANSLSFANLGQLYWRYLHEYGKAEMNFKISIKNDPKDVSMYTSLSDLYWYSYQEKKELADDILFEGLSVNPDSTDLFKHLASLYERMGAYAKALEWWQKVLAADPENREVASTIHVLEKKMSP